MRRKRAEEASAKDPSRGQLPLGYSFHDEELLNMALTHPSGGGSSSDLVSKKKRKETDFERLEFLGDRVLGLVIAHLLYQRYPKETEGDLAKRLASLVSRSTCRLVANKLNLKDYLTANRSDITPRSSILADSLEAIIGSIFLDGGLDPARVFIETQWNDFWNHTAPPPKDAKTTLQEWAQGQGFLVPRYRLISTDGPAHEPSFSVEVFLEKNHESPSSKKASQMLSKEKEHIKAIGKGSSKRLAEQEAAEIFLKSLKKSSHL